MWVFFAAEIKTLLTDNMTELCYGRHNINDFYAFLSQFHKAISLISK